MNPLTRFLRRIASPVVRRQAERADHNRAQWRDRALAAERQAGAHSGLLAAQRRVASDLERSLTAARAEVALLKTPPVVRTQDEIWAAREQAKNGWPVWEEPKPVVSAHAAADALEWAAAREETLAELQCTWPDLAAMHEQNNWLGLDYRAAWEAFGGIDEYRAWEAEHPVEDEAGV